MPQATQTTPDASSRLWSIGTVLVAFIMALPVMVVLGHFFVPTGEVWTHLVETVLQDYVTNSLLLMLYVAVGSLILGVGSAWLASMCEFKGRAIFEWALLLPMAMPAYIIAYTYTGMFDFAGPVQTTLRETMGWEYDDYWFPEIRSLEGAALMMSLVLYPYVYLLTRAAFLSQSICVLDVSRTMGYGYWRTFFRVALPLARPAIVAGLSLALMETLADFGTVQYFGVDTFTTGIFRTWYGLDSTAAAAQLSGILMLFVFTLILMERYSRRQSRFHATSQRHQDIRRIPLTGWAGFGAVMFCGGAVFLGFILPAGQLGVWAFSVSEEVIDSAFVELVLNSLMLAGIAALAALMLALFLAYSARQHSSPVLQFAVRMSALGYAVPGTVIAVGAIIPFAYFDNSLDAFMRETFGISTGLLLSGSLFALIFAYLVRFLAVSLNTVETGLARIKPSMEEAARSMGYRPSEVFPRIHIPMLKGSMLTALLLVFVDVLKELPATLILRPFNFNTLAVRAYELAADERLADAAPAALAIVVAGILPVILLSRSITRTRGTRS